MKCTLDSCKSVKSKKIIIIIFGAWLSCDFHFQGPYHKHWSQPMPRPRLWFRKQLVAFLGCFSGCFFLFLFSPSCCSSSGPLSQLFSTKFSQLLWVASSFSYSFAFSRCPQSPWVVGVFCFIFLSAQFVLQRFAFAAFAAVLPPS